jgi:hypothetical protein
MKGLYEAFLRNRKRVGEVVLAVSVAALAFPEVQKRPGLVLALTLVGVAIRQAGATESDRVHQERKEIADIVDRYALPEPAPETK